MTDQLETPVSRTLTAVLRRSLDQPHQLQLITATMGAPIAGADANAYTNVVIQGTSVRVPYLRGANIGAPGDAAYLLATPDFLLLIGTVKR